MLLSLHSAHEDPWVICELHTFQTLLRVILGLPCRIVLYVIKYSSQTCLEAVATRVRVCLQAAWHDVNELLSVQFMPNWHEMRPARK
jgi:hypothetical protein